VETAAVIAVAAKPELIVPEYGLPVRGSDQTKKCFATLGQGAFERREQSHLDVHDLEASLKALHGIVTHARPPLMRDKSGISAIGNRVGDKPEIQFLVLVDFLPAGHPGDMDVADPVNVIAQRPRDVAIRDLSVVNVEQNFYARRIDSLTHIQTPRHMIEDLVGALVRGDLRIRNFHADVDALLLGIALHAVEYRHCIIGSFFARHAPPFTRDRNENGASNAGAHVDPRMRGFFNLGVDLLAD
jgi:hypothetical protein